MNYCNIRNISKTCLAVFLISIVFCNDFACSQIDKTDSSRPVNTTNSIDNKAANPTNVENLKEKVNQFLSLDDSNPITRNSHIYYNIAVEILSYDELLDLAEKVIKKGIEINTLKNLRKTYPDMTENSIKHQQKLEFGRLYCQYAWLLWKKNQLENAYDTIKKAMNYIPLPTPNDYMRLGIIEYDNGEKPQGYTLSKRCSRTR